MVKGCHEGLNRILCREKYLAQVNNKLKDVTIIIIMNQVITLIIHIKLRQSLWFYGRDQ